MATVWCESTSEPFTVSGSTLAPLVESCSIPSTSWECTCSGKFPHHFQKSNLDHYACLTLLSVLLTSIDRFSKNVVYDTIYCFPMSNTKIAQTFRSSRVFVRQLWQAVQTKGQAEGAHEANALVREGGPSAAETKPTITQQKICAQGESPSDPPMRIINILFCRFPRRTTTDSSTSATSACWASKGGACWWTTWPSATLRSDQTLCLSWICPSWKPPETTFASIVIR